MRPLPRSAARPPASGSASLLTGRGRLRGAELTPALPGTAEEKRRAWTSPTATWSRLARDGDRAAFRLLVGRAAPADGPRPRGPAVPAAHGRRPRRAVQDEVFLQAFLRARPAADPRPVGRAASSGERRRAQRRRAPLTLLGDLPETLHPASAENLPSAEDLDRAEVLSRAVACCPLVAPRRHPVRRRSSPPGRSPARPPAPPRPACTRPAAGCACTSPRTAPTSSPPSPETSDDRCPHRARRPLAPDVAPDGRSTSATYS